MRGPRLSAQPRTHQSMLLQESRTRSLGGKAKHYTSATQQWILPRGPGLRGPGHRLSTADEVTSSSPGADENLTVLNAFEHGPRGMPATTTTPMRRRAEMEHRTPTQPAAQTTGHNMKVRRPRAARACDLCRVKKNKCDELYPCTYCKGEILEPISLYNAASHPSRQIVTQNASTGANAASCRSMPSPQHCQPPTCFRKLLTASNVDM
jgi:hypothetical protein